MKSPAATERRGQNADRGDLDSRDDAASGTPATTHVQTDLLAEPLVISKFWKSGRDRKNSIVVSIRSYEGHTFLDCRLFDTNSEGQSVPTAKGVTIGMRRLPQFADAVAKALAKARDLGLLEGPAE